MGGFSSADQHSKTWGLLTGTLGSAAASMGRDGSGALPRVPSSGVVKAAPVVVTSRDHGGGAGPGGASGVRPPPVTSPTGRQGSGSPNSAQPSPRQVRAYSDLLALNVQWRHFTILNLKIQHSRFHPAPGADPNLAFGSHPYRLDDGSSRLPNPRS